MGVKPEQLLFPCLGSSYAISRDLLQNHRSGKAYFTLLINLLGRPWRRAQSRRLPMIMNSMSMPDSPIFIIGHWRTGSTLLHNLMSLHPQLAYLDYWQGLFPGACTTQHPMRSIVRLLMPDSRPMDDMKMRLDYPQEDEIVSLHMSGQSFYRVHYFPEQIWDLWKQMKTAASQEAWIRDMTTAVQLAMYRQSRSGYVSKNPVNTMRVDSIQSTFPDARFIFTYRKPEEVFLSTMRLYRKVLPLTSHSLPDEEVLAEQVVRIYLDMTEKWNDSRKRLPSERFVEVEFSRFTADIQDGLTRIVDHLSLPREAAHQEAVRTYLTENRQYQAASYDLASLVLYSDRVRSTLSEITRIQASWA